MREMRDDTELRAEPICDQRPAEKLGALAHAEDAVAARRLAISPGGERIADRELQVRLAVADAHVSGAVAVPGGIRERLLHDSVGGLVEPTCERPRRPFDRRLDLETAEAIALDERPQRGEADWWFDRLSAPVLSKPADEQVDFADGFAREVLDRAKRRTGRTGIALLQEARGPGLDEDHVDRMRGGVVQVACDACPLLGSCKASLAFHFLLRPAQALHEVNAPAA